MACALLCLSCTEKAQTLYVGTYGEALHILKYDPDKGTLEADRTVPAVNASYICMREDSEGQQTMMFGVSENSEESGVYSFSKGSDGEWTENGYTGEVGADPCYILDIKGTGMVFTADYTQGSFSIFDASDGKVGKRIQSMEFEGAHIHQGKEIPRSICEGAGVAGRHMLVSDLGNDIILIERITDNGIELEGTIECGEGTGPRHLEFNEPLSMLYCITELSGEVLVWKIDSNEGVLRFTPVQRLTADQAGAAGSADIHLHPSGRWLYTSHRLKNDGIAIMSVKKDGTLEMAGYRNTNPHPRNFTFSPDGRRMLVACRDSKSIQVFDIDPSTGLLSEEFQEFSTGDDGPVCLVFGNN